MGKNARIYLKYCTFVLLNSTIMATTSSTDTKKYWLFFLIALVIFLFMLVFVNEWFWVAMPFMLTYLVLAMRVV